MSIMSDDEYARMQQEEYLKFRETQFQLLAEKYGSYEGIDKLVKIAELEARIEGISDWAKPYRDAWREEEHRARLYEERPDRGLEIDYYDAIEGIGDLSEEIEYLKTLIKKESKP